MSSTNPRKRAALYVRVSTADRGQTVENQLRPLQEAAARLGWTIAAVHRDEGVSGAKGRARRPGLDALLRGVTRREFDIVAAWSVCRLGRSLPDLIGLLGELQARDVNLYLHQQALDTAMQYSAAEPCQPPPACPALLACPPCRTCQPCQRRPSRPQARSKISILSL